MSPPSKDAVLYTLIWTLTVLALIGVLLLKGCCVANCENMLAECERGLMELAAEVDRLTHDGGHP